MQDQIATEKQRNSELESLLEKREVELNSIRAVLDKKQKQIVGFFFKRIQECDFEKKNIQHVMQNIVEVDWILVNSKLALELSFRNAFL